MARSKDRSLAEVKKIRAGLSARLLKAKRKGKLHQEMLALHAEAKEFLRDASRKARASRGRKHA